MSDSVLWFFGNWREKSREKELIEKLKTEENFMTPLKLKDITDANLESYVGLFLPGGHRQVLGWYYWLM